MILITSSGVTSLGEVVCVFFIFFISSRHSGDTAPWWQEDKTVKRWQGSERMLVPACGGLEMWVDSIA